MKRSFIFWGLSVCCMSSFFYISKAENKTEKRPESVVITYLPKQVSKIVPLRTVSYSTIESICKPLLSKTGTMAHLKVRNSIILFDYQTNVDKIAKLIDKIDLPAVNIRVEVDFIGNSSRQQDHLYGKVGYKKYPTKNNQIIIRNGKVIKPNRITISAGQGRQTGSRNTSQFIMTKSGYPAQLWVGKRIVDPTWLQYRQLRPTWVIVGPGGGTVVVPGSDNDIVWADIGSSLYVLPTYLGNGKIDVEVYPVVSYLVDEPDDFGNNRKKRKRRRPKRKRQSVKVEDVSTRLTLQSGQRVSLGGVISSNKNFYTNLFGPDFLNRDDSNSILDMYITATVVDPAGRSYKSNIPYTSHDSSPVKNQEREDPANLFRRR
jgi:type II secretory pathway component GspD/PulD (secretin)